MVKKIVEWAKKLENLNKNYNWFVVVIYVISISLVSATHEPWFDEAQAWLIARDASIYDIVFKIPHYEGHPPLWHLYLALFAKSGVPYEIGLKIASITINSIAIALLIFKAPFPRIIRFMIPFTYFFFYQYGVISRCYSLAMLGFILLALSWSNRNKRPFAFCGAMVLICLSSAYGILFCGGIALVWLWEIRKEYNLKKFVFRFIRDKRFFALLLLLLITLGIAIVILPKENTYAANLSGDFNSFFIRLFYMLVLAPIDAIFFTSIPGHFLLPYIDLAPLAIVFGTVLFAVLLCVLLLIGNGYKKIKLLLIPYLLFAIFSANLYFAVHHSGMIVFFLVFWLWVCRSDSDDPYTVPACIKKGFIPSDILKLKKIVWLMMAASIMISLSWSVSASINEAKINYSTSRDVSDFIKSYGLEDKLIMTNWHITKRKEGKAISNINHQQTPEFSAYFRDNIFYTFNNGNDYLNYDIHVIPTEADINNAINTIKVKGYPDIVINEYSFIRTFDYKTLEDNYTLVRIFKSSKIVKYYVHDSLDLKIYARNDLIDEYGLIEIE